LLALPAFAGTDLSFFDTVLSIQRDGSVVVVEHFAPTSPSGHVVWSTPTEYLNRSSIHLPRLVEVLQVTTANGQPLVYSGHRRDGRLVLDIDTGGIKEVRLLYTVRNAIDFRSDHDRLMWNPGEGWVAGAEHVTVFVQVPPELAGTFSAQAYVSGRGLLPVRESSAGPDRVWFAAQHVNAADYFLIDVALPSGTITPPAAVEQIGWFVRANTIVLLPFVVLGVMLALRRIKSVPEDDISCVAARYEPPAGLTPAEVGVLIDDSLDPRDITATIIDLAVRKYVRLEQGTPDEGVHFDGQDFIIRLMRPMEEWKELQPHEQTVLFHTFYGGEWTKLSSLTLRFYTIVPALRAQIGTRLRLKGFYWIDPQKAPSLRLFNFGVLAAVLYLVQVAGIFSFADSWLLSLISVAASALIVHLLGRRLTAKTRKGMVAYREILGFHDFLNSVDRDRLERLPADLFERCLPYAIALGVEHHWADAFSGIALGSPEWFSADPAAFDTMHIARVIDLFYRPKNHLLSIAPRGASAKA